MNFFFLHRTGVLKARERVYEEELITLRIDILNV